MTKRIYTIYTKIFIPNIYTRYARNFNDGNTLETEEELRDMKYILKKPRIAPVDI